MKKKKVKTYTIKRVVWEFYEIEAISKQEAIEHLANPVAGPYEVRVIKETVVKIGG